MKYVLMSGSFTKMEIYDEIINFINKNIKGNKIISFIASSFGDYESTDHFVHKILTLFTDKKIYFNDVKIIDNRMNRNEMINNIKISNIVFLLGGDTLAQIDYINKYNLKDVINDKNRIVMGMSAGAINMAKKVVLAKDEEDNIPEMNIYDGLGITTLNIEPHCDFKNAKHWKDLESASKYTNLIVMHDDCFIIVDNDRVEYYGSFLNLHNGIITYNGQECTLEHFLKEINYD